MSMLDSLRAQRMWSARQAERNGGIVIVHCKNYESSGLEGPSPPSIVWFFQPHGVRPLCRRGLPFWLVVKVWDRDVVRGETTTPYPCRQYFLIHSFAMLTQNPAADVRNRTR